jgi:hypothetical protein
LRTAVNEAKDDPRITFDVYMDGVSAARLGLPSNATFQQRVNAMADIGDGGGGGPFAWELSLLRSEGMLPNVRFIEGGNVVENPFRGS